MAHLPVLSWKAHTRKLVDVEKRMEALRERLVERMLYPETVQELMYLLQFLQARDYNNALGYHQHLVTTTNPDVTGAFLVGIKSLVGICKAIDQGQ